MLRRFACRWLHCESTSTSKASSPSSSSDTKPSRKRGRNRSRSGSSSSSSAKSSKKDPAKTNAAPPWVSCEVGETRKQAKNNKDQKINKEDRETKQRITSYIRELQKCNSRAHLPELRHLHSRLVAAGYAQRGAIALELIHMYGQCGSPSDARLVFDTLPGETRSMEHCNATIVACTQNGDAPGAKAVFESLGKRGAAAVAEPCTYHDRSTSNSMIAALGKSKAVGDARRLFDDMRRKDDVSWTSIVAVYAQNGHSRDAKAAFDAMPRWNLIVCTAVLSVCPPRECWALFTQMEDRDAFSWGVLISALARHSRLDEARAVFDRMPLQTTVSWTTTITAYAKSGHMDEALRLFDAMPQPDVITWTSVMTALAQGGSSRQVVDMFKRMDLEGIEADKYSFSIVLDACARLSDVSEGRRLHATIAELGPMDAAVTNALLNMYGKCGNMTEAVAVFDAIAAPLRVTATWNALIAAYTENGWHNAAFGAFRHLNLDGSVQPNAITFTGIFTACSHTGKLADARDHFVTMTPDFGVAPLPDHYACMADLLGRVGRLADGEELISSMPFDPHPAIWLALMGSCRTHLNADIAERAAEHVYKSHPSCPSPYILLSNIYAALGRTKDLLRIRRLMKIRGVKNNRALSYVQVNDRLVPFSVAPWTKDFYRRHCARSG